MSNVAYQKLKDTNALPSPAGVALQLLRIMDDERVTLGSIGKVVESDPALAGRVLKLANSPFAGLARKVASVSEAVTLLGLRPVRNLALGMSLVSGIRGSCKGFDYANFWSESLARAVAARRLALTLKSHPPDEAFVGGLVGKVGCLAFATAHAEQYSSLLMNTSAEQVDSLARKEKEVFGLDQNELSAEMMADWWLQSFLCQAVRFQDAPGADYGFEPRARALARLLHLASSIASVLTRKEAHLRNLGTLIEEARTLAIPQEEVAPLFDAIANEWRQAGAIFSVSTTEVLPLDTLRALAEENSPKATETADTVRILIVDDDPAMLRLIEKYLTPRGYRIMTASSAVEALDTDRRQAPQIVITDWMMPDVDGLELCRQLRAQDGSGFVYILVLTAQSEKGKAVQALEAGADDFLSKPFSREELLAHVRAGERIVRLEVQLSDRSREIARMNATLSATNDKLRIMATTDELTGLVNRREGLARLAEYWSSANRSGESLSCMIADIDHFKAVNDTYGHAAGDAVLKATAATLRQSARAGEIVCRFGGEEFLVLCPKSPTATAVKAANRLRLAVASSSVSFNEGRLSVAISLGVAERTNSMVCPDELLKAADEMLYAAKAAGRNRVAVARGCSVAIPCPSSQ